MIHYVVPRDRAFTLQYFLDDRPGPAADRFVILPSEEFVRQTSLNAGTYVFADDDVTPAERRVFVHIWDQLEAAAPRTQILNHPGRTLGRLEFLTAMFAAGRNRFRAVSAVDWPAPVTFPVFIRDRERHNGSMTPLLRSRSDVTRLLRWFVWKGHRREDLLVVEYCETADTQGLYRKYSSYIVGDQIVPRCVEFGTKWMVKHDFRLFDDARIHEEYEYVVGNPHESWLREVFALARVTYGRIDYSMLDGAPQVFEINLNPTVARGWPMAQETEERLHFRALRSATNEKFYSAFDAAWAALDAQTVGADPVHITADPSLVAPAARERRAKIRGESRRAAIERVVTNPAISTTMAMVRRFYLGRTGR